ERPRLAEFVEAAWEPLTAVEEAVLAVQADPTNMDSVRQLASACEAVRELAGHSGFTPAEELAVRLGALLRRVLEGSVPCRGGYADLVLRSCDMMRLLVAAARDVVGGEPFVEPEGFGDLLSALDDPSTVGVSPDEDPAVPESLRLGDILVARDKANREDLDAIAMDQGNEPIGVAIVRSEAASLTDVGQALRTQQRLKAGGGPNEPYVRVRTDRLDRLIDTIGELVIAQSMVAQDQTVASSENHELARKVAHTSKIVRELQDLSMAMRMVPLKAVFQKMARVVRDVAQKSGKSARLVTEGEDTEIDRNMVEVVNDPILHLVRNAVDHGIEPAWQRENAGKPAVGTVRLSAYHSGGNVVIEVQDDGRGLDREAILRKAVSQGMIDGERTLSDADVFNLIFAPGFSTANEITDVSGRGVGLDVVKSRIEAMRGRVTIDSQPGKGTTFRLYLPLTMAITDGMLVRVGRERYIIPTVSIHMSLRPEADDVFTVTGRGEMFRLRDELIPIFRLHRVFQVRDAVDDPTRGLLVIVDDGNGRCALLVDELLGQQQVVAKSLGDGLGKVPGVSGGAILGDGRVGLILDAQGVAELARRSEIESGPSVVRR
ncbi:MAG: chemotaxis protein CheA, partial [Armatimonadota bacterium]